MMFFVSQFSTSSTWRQEEKEEDFSTVAALKMGWDWGERRRFFDVQTQWKTLSGETPSIYNVIRRWVQLQRLYNVAEAYVNNNNNSNHQQSSSSPANKPHSTQRVYGTQIGFCKAYSLKGKRESCKTTTSEKKKCFVVFFRKKKTIVTFYNNKRRIVCLLHTLSFFLRCCVLLCTHRLPYTLDTRSTAVLQLHEISEHPHLQQLADTLHGL